MQRYAETVVASFRLSGRLDTGPDQTACLKRPPQTLESRARGLPSRAVAAPCTRARHPKNRCSWGPLAGPGGSGPSSGRLAKRDGRLVWGRSRFWGGRTKEKTTRDSKLGRIMKDLYGIYKTNHHDIDPAFVCCMQKLLFRSLTTR